ncbi:hypothetical protein JHK82_035465 [Glycine max]|nr:hypothetical protein JHK85_036183 [Glycine max]KAG5112196.1 hypothetical protein JHK82_035465 [Glycine max]
MCLQSVKLGLGHALKNVALEFTKLVLHEYKTTTNMSEQFSPLVAIAQNPGKIRDDALVDFCGKLLHHFLDTIPSYVVTTSQRV